MSIDVAAWGRPAVAAQVLRRRRDGLAELALRIPALGEPAQVLRLERVLQALPGVRRMSFDIAARRARLVIDDAALSLPDLLAACHWAGCDARPLHGAQLEDDSRKALNASLQRLLVAGLFAMQAMMFALVLYLGAGGTSAELFRWLAMLSAAPVVGYAAWPFYRDALDGLRARRPGIDVPVALAVGLIYVASAVNTVRGGGDAYFDSVSMFVFVLLLGRHLQLRARLRHRSLGEAAADAMPLLAQRRRPGGALEQVAAAELQAGDRVHVAEGEAVPCDGVLESRRARTNDALLTGEARACERRRGDAVAAGSIALDGPLELRATREVAASTTSVLARLAAQATRGEQDDAEARPARRFVWRVLALALATAAFWIWRDPARAFDATVAVLVVACPCAFGLAAPAVLTRSMAVLARMGVLVARPSALAALARADRALLDKTGTLTEPALAGDRVQAYRDLPVADVLRLAAALAAASHHPLARAVTRACGAGELPEANDVEATAGGGLAGSVEGRALRLGHARFAGTGDGDDDALWLADAWGPLARMPVAEMLRPGTLAAVAALRAAGIEPAIVSGDAAPRVREIAARLRVEDWAARQSPEQKLARIRSEQALGKVVMAVGDGSNDAAALAAADVAVVTPGATDLARSHAGLVLLHGLPDLVGARELARRAASILAVNRRWSLAWNLGAVPFAALGFISPWLAAIGMSASSLAVVLNTLRIREPAVPRDTPAAPLQVSNA